MHINSVTKSRALPRCGAITDTWGDYEESWAYLMIFVVVSVFFPRKF